MNTLTMIVASLVLASSFSFGTAHKSDEATVEQGVQRNEIPPPAPPTDDATIDDESATLICWDC